MKFQTQSLSKALVQYANQKDGNIRSCLAEDALNSIDPVMYLEDVVQFGCRSGVASRMVYYGDTHEFFDQYYHEIEDLLYQYKNQLGFIPCIQGDLKNSLAWMAYEYSAQLLLEEIRQYL